MWCARAGAVPDAEVRRIILEGQLYTPLETEPECAICIAKGDEQNPLVSAQCPGDGQGSDKHLFHMTCMKRWFELLDRRRQRPQCPLCRGYPNLYDAIMPAR